MDGVKRKHFTKEVDQPTLSCSTATATRAAWWRSHQTGRRSCKNRVALAPCKCLASSHAACCRTKMASSCTTWLTFSSSPNSNAHTQQANQSQTAAKSTTTTASQATFAGIETKYTSESIWMIPYRCAIGCTIRTSCATRPSWLASLACSILLACAQARSGLQRPSTVSVAVASCWYRKLCSSSRRQPSSRFRSENRGRWRCTTCWCLSMAACRYAEPTGATTWCVSWRQRIRTLQWERCGICLRASSSSSWRCTSAS